MLDADLLATLRRVDTPTVCNAIEVAQGTRGFQGFTRGTPVATHPQRVMVGFARTARIRGRRPPDAPKEAVRARRMDYHRYMAAGPRPAVAVVEDLDGPDCVGAFWGEVNATLHRGLGVAGALTNGVVRDLGDLPEDFPVVAGSLGPSHGFVHVVEVDVPVAVLGLAVRPGALVHADRHGAVVIPEDVLPRLGGAIETLAAAERLILDPARRPDFDLAALETAWAAFERART